MASPQNQPGSAVAVKEATFFPVLACNARCPFCSTRVYVPGGVRSINDHAAGVTRPIHEHSYSFEEAVETLKAMRRDGATRISYQGGEPTLFPRLDELIVRAREMGFEHQLIVTNGRMFHRREYAERIVRAGVDVIALSIFGADAATHDEAMGVEGCFADMVGAVENLVALRAEGWRTSLTAQLVLYARNFRDLPAMVRFWHERGLRTFAARLLRETVNIQSDPLHRWYFDLAELVGPLQSALDLAFSLDGARVVLSELPFCLPDSSFLPAVLADLRHSGERLHQDKLVVSRDGKRLANYAGTRQIEEAKLEACARCDLSRWCMKIERQYLGLYSGQVRPIRLREAVEAVLAAPVTERSHRRLRALLGSADALERLGAPVDELRLRAALGAFYQERDPRAMAEVLLGEEASHRWRGIFRRREPRTTFRYLPRSAAGALEADMARLDETPLVALHGKKIPNPRVPEQVYAVIYDDRWLSEDRARRLVDALQ